MITVSTDGSCLRNPGGAIGWAWANHDGSSASGGHPAGTNQIAELMAVLEAIRSHPGDQPLVIQADSQYAIKCASAWITRGWSPGCERIASSTAMSSAIWLVPDAWPPLALEPSWLAQAHPMAPPGLRRQEPSVLTVITESDSAVPRTVGRPAALARTGSFGTHPLTWTAGSTDVSP